VLAITNHPQVCTWMTRRRHSSYVNVVLNIEHTSLQRHSHWCWTYRNSGGCVSSETWSSASRTWYTSKCELRTELDLIFTPFYVWITKLLRITKNSLQPTYNASIWRFLRNAGRGTTINSIYMWHVNTDWGHRSLLRKHVKTQYYCYHLQDYRLLLQLWRWAVMCLQKIGQNFYQRIRYCVRFEVFTVVTMKNGDFWDIKTEFLPHRRHITSPLQSPAS
jgi:hypothetical protein